MAAAATSVVVTTSRVLGARKVAVVQSVRRAAATVSALLARS
jgi:IclR family KDG regulon transcriptional repressor